MAGLAPPYIFFVRIYKSQVNAVFVLLQLAAKTAAIHSMHTDDGGIYFLIQLK